MGKKFAEDLIRADEYAQAANKTYARTSKMLNATNESLREAQSNMVETLRLLGEKKISHARFHHGNGSTYVKARQELKA